MTNFEVVYIYGENQDMLLPSRVYAVDRMSYTFLIVDGWGKFRWVPMDQCIERSAWECDNGPLLPIDDDPDDDEADSEPDSAWDSYDRLVSDGL